MENNENITVILFDGVCNLCNSWVNFVLKRDPRRTFFFAPLQSEVAQQLMQKFNVSSNDFDSMVLIEGSKYYVKSMAALRIARHLGGIWPLIYLFIVVPQGWRDKAYDFIANNRYHWFGRVEQCKVPGSDARFLN